MVRRSTATSTGCRAVEWLQCGRAMYLLCALGLQICKVMCRFLSPRSLERDVPDQGRSGAGGAHSQRTVTNEMSPTRGDKGPAPPAQGAVPPPSRRRTREGGSRVSVAGGCSAYPGRQGWGIRADRRQDTVASGQRVCAAWPEGPRCALQVLPGVCGPPV